jgi:hypothetical protein
VASKREAEQSGVRGEQHDNIEHATDFAYTLLTQFAGQVVEHQRAQHYVELRIWKGQRFRNSVLEGRIDSCLAGLQGRSCNHLGGRVDAENPPVCANLAFGNNRECSGSASNVEHGFARDEVRQASELLAEGAIGAAREKPDQEVVSGGPMQDTTKRCRWSMR